jgi:hypothetical protein
MDRKLRRGRALLVCFALGLAGALLVGCSGSGSGQATGITYRADSARNAVTGRSVRLAVERYEFTRNGRQVTITLSAPVGSDDVDPWKTITNSFGWTA